MVLKTSGKKVWWLCSEGHEWEARIRERTTWNSKCPFCSGKADTYIRNDIAWRNRKLMKEWHPNKNRNINPNKITPNSGKIVWWLCSEGHEWEASIVQRTRGNTNCPVCSEEKTKPQIVTLGKVSRKLSKEWHPTRNITLKPYHISITSIEKVWWQCEKGHEWQASVANRFANKTGCPICVGERKTSFPEQAIYYYLAQKFNAISRARFYGKEVDILLPEEGIGIEYDGIRYHSSDDALRKEATKDNFLINHGIQVLRVKEANIEDIKVEGNVIKYKYKSDNSGLDKVIYELLSLVEEITGKSISININVDLDRYKIWEQYVIQEKENSFANKSPEKVIFWHVSKNGKLLPEHVSNKSTKKVWWQCLEGHEYQATVASVSSGVQCPICRINNKNLRIDREILQARPDFYKIWHPTKNSGYSINDFSIGSNKIVWWQCSEGHEYQASIISIVNGKQCPECNISKPRPGRQGLLLGHNDLASMYPNIASEWHPRKNGKYLSSDFLWNSKRKVWWLCCEGHEWHERIELRTSGLKCPICEENS